MLVAARDVYLSPYYGQHRAPSGLRVNQRIFRVMSNRLDRMLLIVGLARLCLGIPVDNDIAIGKPRETF